MRFLALSTLQTLLLSAITAAAIIALYFLKLRHRRVLVSSSLLWQKVLDDPQSHTLMERLRRFLSILLAVSIALLIAIGIARPEIRALSGQNERIVIVLDTSPTMGAHASDGRSRWEHALDEASSLLTIGGPTTEFRVSDTSGRMASGFTTDRNEIRQLISKMSPVAAEPQFPKVDATGSQVYFISDGVALSQIPQGVRKISVFEKAENVGITAFEIRSMPSTPQGYQAFLEVQNFGTAAAEADLTLSGVGGQRVNRKITLAPEETFQEVFDLTKFEGGAVRASLQSRNDALTTDDLAYAYLPIKRRSRTMLVTRGSKYLETLLKLDSFVEVTVTDPASFKENGDVDVYIFDRFAPPTPPSRPALIVGAPDVPWLRPPQGMVQKPAITSWVENHPIMQAVSVHDVSIEKAARVDARDLTIVASSNDVPLIIASERPRWVQLTFDLEQSDFPLHTAFPIFIDNTLAWFSRDQIALSRVPGTVEIPLANAQIRTMDDKVVPSQQQLNNTVFQATEPGLFTVTQGNARAHVAVNLANRGFSDVNRSTYRKDPSAATGASWLRRELWFYMFVLAVILISFEWYTYHRRITL